VGWGREKKIEARGRQARIANECRLQLSALWVDYENHSESPLSLRALRAKPMAMPPVHCVTGLRNATAMSLASAGVTGVLGPVTFAAIRLESA